MGMTVTSGRAAPGPEETSALRPVVGNSQRRLTAGAHAEFVAVLIQEFRRALAPLRVATEMLGAHAGRLEASAVAEMAEVADRQGGRLWWLVRLLDAVDGPPGGRRVEGVGPATVAAQAARGLSVPLEVNLGAPDYTLEADAERLRLGLEALLLGLGAESGGLEAEMPTPRLLVIPVGRLDLDDVRRRWELRAGWRILESEGCQVRVQRAATGTRVTVRFD